MNNQNEQRNYLLKCLEIYANRKFDMEGRGREGRRLDIPNPTPTPEEDEIQKQEIDEHFELQDLQTIIKERSEMNARQVAKLMCVILICQVWNINAQNDDPSRQNPNENPQELVQRYKDNEWKDLIEIIEKEIGQNILNNETMIQEVQRAFLEIIKDKNDISMLVEIREIIGGVDSKE